MLARNKTVLGVCEELGGNTQYGSLTENYIVFQVIFFGLQKLQRRREIVQLIIQ
jgi:hypothetical protein